MTSRRGRVARLPVRRPARYIVVTFLAVTAAGTALLLLPVLTRSGASPAFTTALFTATSATCVTGLAVVDTPVYWSSFGHVVLLVLMQIGGLGTMTLTSLLVIVVSRRLGLRQQVIAAAQTRALRLGDVKTLVTGVVKLTFAVEAAVALVLFVRFWTAHHEPFGRAVWLAVFHAVSAFNNAGFSLFSDSLVGFHGDIVVLGAIAVAVIVGGLGYPVWRQIAASPRRFGDWDLHAKVTVVATLALIVSGWALFALFEWTNPGTLGPMSGPDSVLGAFFQSVTTRTAGFNALDVGALDDGSKLVTMILMFIGGGSGSTAGGIKVTTFALLAMVLWAEMRGDRDVDMFGRRVPSGAERQAVSVVLLAVGTVVIGSMLLVSFGRFALDDVLFEAVSALGTVGLSTGITPELTEPARLVVTVLMFMGRVGPPTLFAALVLRDRDRLYRHPEERMIIG